ncbi:MAG: hypothetical protein IKW76_10345 [Clostridia bacterium]|nr:hypothetical protein [Clostridia bacterium]
MKKICLLFAAVLLLTASGCGRYVSHYKAIGFAHSNASDSAFMSFYSFDGRMVFKLRCKNGSDGQLRYSAKLESGSAAVYYDDNGTKTALCTVAAGDALESSVGLSEKGTVYVIVETSEPCMNGDFSFAV